MNQENLLKFPDHVFTDETINHFYYKMWSVLACFVLLVLINGKFTKYDKTYLYHHLKTRYFLICYITRVCN